MFVCVLVRVCASKYVSTCTCMRVCMSVRVCVCERGRVCVWVPVHVYASDCERERDLYFADIDTFYSVEALAHQIQT